ncbi:MAG: phosphoribosylformylglycinamidine synthase, purS protein [Acidimicrobiales bacterium]|nr:phosphoribosylformylglycinamidine synthase, purS protein [Acidimicrobiales bacterium]
MTFEAFVEVRRHPGIADPEGATIERSLPTLGFAGVSGVSVGKAFRLTVEAADEAAARSTVEALAERLLANPVLEEVRVSITEGATA